MTPLAIWCDEQKLSLGELAAKLRLTLLECADLMSGTVTARELFYHKSPLIRAELPKELIETLWSDQKCSHERLEEAYGFWQKRDAKTGQIIGGYGVIGMRCKLCGQLDPKVQSNLPRKCDLPAAA